MNFIIAAMSLLFISCVSIPESASRKPNSSNNVFDLIDKIEMDKNGAPLIASYTKAKKICEAKGSRLPNSREYAEYSKFFGAMGTLETKYPDMDVELKQMTKVSQETTQMAQQGFSALFLRTSSSKLVVDFYYNFSGYQAPQIDSKQRFFWIEKQSVDDGNFVFDHSTGSINWFAPGTEVAIRCLKSSTSK